MSKATEAQLIRCQNCGATNRVPVEKLNERVQPVCGRCKQPLTMRTGPVTVTDANYETEVAGASLPVLLDMWAAWCGPCRMLAPIIDQLATELSGRVIVGKLNVDESPVTASRFGVRSIPTLLIIRDGREVDRIVGVAPKQLILEKLLSVL